MANVTQKQVIYTSPNDILTATAGAKNPNNGVRPYTEEYTKNIPAETQHFATIKVVRGIMDFAEKGQAVLPSPEINTVPSEAIGAVSDRHVLERLDRMVERLELIRP